MQIDYCYDRRPEAAEIARLYDAARLVRPTGDLKRIQKMYAGSTVVWSAWDGSRLVGILRGWTDGGYDGYVCDLAVALITRNRELEESCSRVSQPTMGRKCSGSCAPQS